MFPQSPVPIESYLSPMASSLFLGALLLHAQSSKEKTFCMVPPHLDTFLLPQSCSTLGFPAYSQLS